MPLQIFGQRDDAAHEASQLSISQLALIFIFECSLEPSGYAMGLNSFIMDFNLEKAYCFISLNYHKNQLWRFNYKTGHISSFIPLSQIHNSLGSFALLFLYLFRLNLRK